MQRLVAIISSPGAKIDIEEAAPTLRAPLLHASSPGEKIADSTAEGSGLGNKHNGLPDNTKTGVLDRCLDRLVQASGSEPVFLIILAGLLLWAFLGIKYGSSPEWAVGVSDAQALISYFFDSLLMRQLLNGYTRLIRVTASLRSRSISHRRMLSQVLARGQHRTIETNGPESSTQVAFEAGFPSENWLGRVSTAVSKVFGHLITICLYWVCIFIWLGFGPYCGWSDTWQLYINSATSALMVLVFAFLANIRERHDAYTDGCLNSIFEVDSAVEVRLRTLTGDTAPNPVVVVPAPKLGRLQRAIFYYADVVGTLIGIVLLIVVMAVWLAIGPALSFDSNWWLVIGTYAGLIGLNDGFVLRNVQAKFISYEDDAFEEVRLEDLALLEDIRLPDPTPPHSQKRSISHRLSEKMGAVCAHEFTVVSGVVLIFGLIAGASAMGWSETGQLLCNIPPSVIESCFMIMLLTGHNMAESRRRIDLSDIYLRRLVLLDYVNRLELLG